jgi:uncharacterized protein YprB with RNaseH-like and TPR domain
MNKKQWSKSEIEKLMSLRLDGLTWEEISSAMAISPNCARKAFYRYGRDDAKPHGTVEHPKVLILDIETAPMQGYFWGLFKQNIGLEQVLQHTTILSWSAKWLHESPDKVMYRDQRNAKDIRDDKDLMIGIRSLLDEADIVLHQNGESFDIPKLNYRFAMNKLKPYSSIKHIDTLKIAKKVFGFDSNKLAHMTDMFCTKYVKTDHGKFAGFKLWKECLAGNQEAWKEMEKYNKLDVLSLEELYVDHLAPWDQTLNFAAFTEELTFRCNCGSDQFSHKGYIRTKKSKFKRFICDHCGKEHRESKNLFTKEQRDALKV